MAAKNELSKPLIGTETDPVVTATAAVDEDPDEDPDDRRTMIVSSDTPSYLFSGTTGTALEQHP